MVRNSSAKVFPLCLSSPLFSPCASPPWTHSAATAAQKKIPPQKKLFYFFAGRFLVRLWDKCSFSFFAFLRIFLSKCRPTSSRTPSATSGAKWKGPISPKFCLNVQKSVQNISFSNKLFEKSLVFQIWFLIDPPLGWSDYKMPPVSYKKILGTFCPRTYPNAKSSKRSRAAWILFSRRRSQKVYSSFIFRLDFFMRETVYNSLRISTSFYIYGSVVRLSVRLKMFWLKVRPLPRLFKYIEISMFSRTEVLSACQLKSWVYPQRGTIQKVLSIFTCGEADRSRQGKCCSSSSCCCCWGDHFHFTSLMYTQKGCEKKKNFVKK